MGQKGVIILFCAVFLMASFIMGLNNQGMVGRVIEGTDSNAAEKNYLEINSFSSYKSFNFPEGYKIRLYINVSQPDSAVVYSWYVDEALVGGSERSNSFSSLLIGQHNITVRAMSDYQSVSKTWGVFIKKGTSFGWFIWGIGSLLIILMVVIIVILIRKVIKRNRENKIDTVKIENEKLKKEDSDIPHPTNNINYVNDENVI